MCLWRKGGFPSLNWLPRAGAGRKHWMWTFRCRLVLCSRGDSQHLPAGQTPSSAQLPLGGVVKGYKLVVNDSSWSSWGAGMAGSSEGHPSHTAAGLITISASPKPPVNLRSSPGSMLVCWSFCPQTTIWSFSWKRKRHSVHIKAATTEEEIPFINFP